MDLIYSGEDARFRDAVRGFFADEYPQDLLAKARSGQSLTREDHVRSQQALQSRGWLAATWPAEFGGPGWSPMQRYLFDAELERAGAPALIPMALIYIGPIICAFGSAEQQRRWLPDILASRALWAQGYSEPEAGSDLASLRLSAVRDGDAYVLNGTKVWTTGAHWADWIFCLARTSREPRRQDGVSLICVRLDAPGVSVHPIITLEGSHELNRVEFQDVRVPATDRIGEEGRAWRYANVLLQGERLSYAHIARKRMDIARIRTLARETPAGDGGRLIDDARFHRRLAEVEIELDVVEIAVLRALHGSASPAAISALKVLCTEAAQHITELMLEAAGRSAFALLDRTPPDWAAAAPLTPEFAALAAPSYLFERAQTIYGGATEVQKTIIWRALQDGSALSNG